MTTKYISTKKDRLISIKTKDETEETIRETAWNLCKKYDSQNRRPIKILLTNFVSTDLEKLFSAETENLFRNEWQEVVALFCRKYGYSE